MTAARPDTWMPIYWGDYMRDTGHLGALGHGAYLMLIKHYWCTGAPLNDDDDELWRIACCDSKEEWLRLRPKIVRLFTREEGLLRHKRIDIEIARAVAITTAKAKAGKKGAAKRWQDDGKANGTAIAEPQFCYRQTDTQSQSPSQPLESNLPSPPQGGTTPNAPRETNRKLTLAEAISAHPNLKAGAFAKTKRLFEAKGWPLLDFELVFDEFHGYWTGDGARKKKSDWPGTFYNRCVERRTWSAFQLGGPNARGKTTGSRAADATATRRSAIAKGLGLDGPGEGAGGEGRSGGGNLAHGPGMVLEHAGSREGHDPAGDLGAGSDKPRPIAAGNGGDSGQAVRLRAGAGEVPGGRGERGSDMGGGFGGHAAGPAARSDQAHDPVPQVQHAADAGRNQGRGEAGTDAPPAVVVSGKNGGVDLLEIPDFLRRKA